MPTLAFATRRAGRGIAVGALAVSAASLSPIAALAQQPLDRTVVPPVGKSPELHVPAWTKLTLSNGAQLIVSERHTLPLVSFNLSFVGGANQFEPADKTGLASLTASMLSEGTKTRTGDELSNAEQMLGTDIGASIGGESGTINFLAMKDKFEPALALVEDMLVNPSFPSDALERLRARTIVSLQQSRDRTAVIANSVVFPKVLYTTEHPYGRSMSEASVKSVTRDDIVRFHDQFYQPSRAIITVVGDVKPEDVKRMLEKALAPWPAGGSPVTFNYPAAPAAGMTTIYLVDKPGAAQSTFALGLVGPPRDTPDFYALRVMNTMFGELFQSRLNADIREQKGYSYGVSSRFAFGRGPGPFRAGGDIVTAKTDSALIEFMSQIRGIRGERPITDEEMAAAKNALIQSLPERFSSVGAVSAAISEIYVQGLPEDYYQQFSRQVNAVSKEDVVRVAQKYIDPEHLAIVIVGDRKQIEAALAATKIAPIVVLDVNGNPVR